MVAKKQAAAAAEETGTDVMSVQERIKSRLANINNTTQQPSGQNISVKGKVFRLPDGKTSPGPLNCIIVDYVNMNSYYEQGYVEGEFSPPDCTATGRDLKDMAPSSAVEKPINGDCFSCDFNKFESKGRGKMCSNSVLLAILPEDFTSESELYTIKASATALKAWAGYVRLLSGSGVDPIQVVTSLNFEDGLSYPSLRFKQLGGNEKLDDISPFLAKADMLLTS